MNLLYLYEPKIEGDTIHFSWYFDKDPYLFKKNSFYIQYKTVDISSMDRDIFYEMIISLLIPVLKAHGDPYLILSPKEINKEKIDFWLSYNECENISIYPTVRKISDASKFKSVQSDNYKQLGILYGGGKDSLYAYKVNGDLFGLDNILIISYVFPINYSQKNQIDQRRDAFALEHIKNDGVTIQKVVTDFRSNFYNADFFNAIHTQLYFIMNYPLYIHYNLDFITYSYEFTQYWNVDSKGEERFYFKKSRPEFDLFISNHLSKQLNKSLKIFNSNYYLSETAAMHVIKEKYDAIDEVMMCEASPNPETKWCGSCFKCGEFALYLLSLQIKSNSFDLDEFLVGSTFIKKLNQSIYNNNVRNNQGNIAWFKGLVSFNHYMSFCHTIAKIDIDYWTEKLSEDALQTVVQLKDWFGHASYPVLDHYLTSALNQLELPFSNKLRELIDPVLDSTDVEVVESIFMNETVLIDYRRLYPIGLKFNKLLQTEEFVNEIIQSTVTNVSKENNTSVVAVNSLTNKTLPYKSVLNEQAHSFHLEAVAPKKGDLVEATYSLPILNTAKSYHLKMTVQSPYRSTVKKRLEYEIALGDKILLNEDVSEWGNENEINLYFSPDKEAYELKARVLSTYNCEPWNWGKAAQLSVKSIEVLPIAKIDQDYLTCSSPFSKLTMNEGPVN